MLRIEIDSFLHYQLVKQDEEHVVLYRYDDACPQLGDDAHTGKTEVARLDLWGPVRWTWRRNTGEVVEVTTYPCNLNPAGDILCGDDFIKDLEWGQS